ncbi:MAG: winged helix-turn-helix domain-containing protein [Nitrososphaerales archaeon]
MTHDDRPSSDVLKGTTLKVYRYLFKLGRPASIRDVQRGLDLSSPSVAEYHLKKLVQGGLVREAAEGYLVDRVMWDNMIRMRRTIVPFQAFYVVFFAAAFLVMLLVLRTNLEEEYIFGQVIVLIALGLSAYEFERTLRNH